MSDVRLTATNPEDSSVVPVACNAKGELLLEEPIAPPEFDGNLDGDLTVSGSGTFAGNVLSGTTLPHESVKGVALRPEGLFQVSRPNASDEIFVGYQTNGDPAKVIMRAGGSANFAGDLTLGTDKITLDATAGSAIFAGSVRSDDGYIALNGAYNVFNGTQDTAQTAFIVRSQSGADFFYTVTTDGSTFIGNKSGSSGNYGTSNNANTILRANGSATFAGDVVVSSRGKQWMLVEQGGLCHMVQQVRASTADLVDPAAAELDDPAADTEYPKLRDVFAELNVIEKALEEVMEKLRMTEPDGWPVWDGSDNS